VLFRAVCQMPPRTIEGYRIRAYRDTDNDAVHEFWSNGFSEMIVLLKDEVFLSPSTLAAVFAVAAVVGYFAGWVGAAAVVALFAVGVVGIMLHLKRGLPKSLLRPETKIIKVNGTKTPPKDHMKGDQFLAFYVVEQVASGAVIGCVGLKAGYPKEDDDSVTSIWRLSVSKQHRGKMLAHLLMDAAESFARDMGCKRVMLRCGNKHSVAFYLKYGYTDSLISSTCGHKAHTMVHELYGPGSSERNHVVLSRADS